MSDETESDDGCAPFVIGMVIAVALCVWVWWMIPSFLGTSCSHPSRTRFELMAGAGADAPERVCVLTTNGWEPR